MKDDEPRKREPIFAEGGGRRLIHWVLTVTLTVLILGIVLELARRGLSYLPWM